MTYEQEAHWWETHDTADYSDEFERTELKIEPGATKLPRTLRDLSRELVAENLENAVRVRLTNQDHHKLRLLSGQMGVKMATLVRMWILEKLRHSENIARP